MSVSTREIPRRIRRGIRRHGLIGALRVGPYLSESPIWFQLDLAGDRPRRELPEGMTLRRGTAPDLDGMDPELLRVRIDEAHALLRRAGPQLWVVEEAGQIRFVCWLFHGGTPAATARDAWLELPDGVVCLEDSHASPAVRGRGVAPGAWCALADDLQAQGIDTMITKVGAENVASRRAVEKAGFREVLPMSVRRIGPVWRARATSPPDGPLARTLLERLAR